VTESHANQNDVRFDYAAAGELAAEFRSTAMAVDTQTIERDRLSTTAQVEWRGRSSEDFDQRLRTGIRDGQMLADKLRRVARLLDQAANNARAEQARREKARRDEEERENRNLAEKAWHFVFGG